MADIHEDDLDFNEEDFEEVLIGEDEADHFVDHTEPEENLPNQETKQEANNRTEHEINQETNPKTSQETKQQSNQQTNEEIPPDVNKETNCSEKNDDIDDHNGTKLNEETSTKRTFDKSSRLFTQAFKEITTFDNKNDSVSIDLLAGRLPGNISSALQNRMTLPDNFQSRLSGRINFESKGTPINQKRNAVNATSDEEEDTRWNNKKKFHADPTAHERVDPPWDADLRTEGIYLYFDNDDLSTKDIFALFDKSKQDAPEFVEWINDNSCVVIWEFSEDSWRSMDDVSNPLSEEQEREILGYDMNDAPVEIRYRSHKFNNNILLRMATQDDRKRRNAYVHSQYYQRHGYGWENDNEMS